MKKSVVIIGAGTGGMASAILLAKSGYDVTVVEKNETYGGRGASFEIDGFKFDMGPSWYLMPDIFEDFFELIGEKVSDHFTLKKLAPSYRIWFEEMKEPIDMMSDLEKDAAVFEKFEPGVMPRIHAYLKEAEAKYEISKQHFIYKPFNSLLDFFDKHTIGLGSKYSVFTSFHKHLSTYVKNPLARKILQYPLVFLGSSPYKAPAVYSLMNHIDFSMGVFYPMGGMTKVFEALHTIATKHGVKFKYNSPVQKINTENKKAISVTTESGEEILADFIVSNADYNFTETKLLQKNEQQFSKNYWDSRIVAPSGFILYLGVNKKFKNLTHHNLFFTKRWKKSFDDLFNGKELPKHPSYYICAPSVTDPDVAPADKENLFVLVPASAGLTLDDATIKKYRDDIIKHMTETMGLEGLEENIEVERVFTGNDFSTRYNAFKGTALGLAQNLFQTAVFRPKTVSKKVSNLYYVGANTNPGIGVPMCLISAQIVYKRFHNIRHGNPLQKDELIDINDK